MDRTHETALARLDPALRTAETVGEALAAAAERWPDRPYLTFATTGEQVTFAEMDRRAGALAGALASLGVERGDPVGLYLRNGPTLVAAVMACARLGAVQTPLDWQYQEREVRHALDTAEPSVVLVEDDASFRSTLDAAAAEADVSDVVVVPSDTGAATAADEEPGDTAHALADLPDDPPPRPTLSGDDPFALMYTSGTTGLPKPALLSHRSYLLAGTSFLALLDDDPVNYNPFPLFHGNNQFYSMIAPLLLGSRWVLAERFTASRFLDHVVDYGVTSFNILGGTPKLLDAAYDADDVPETDLELAVGPIGAEQWEAFEATFGVRVVQLYSQTESPTLIANHPDPAKVRVGAIGKPMFPDLGHEVTLVDEDGEPVPPGEPGELTRTDPGAMEGYYGMPERTAETLRDGRIHSGDIARRDEDGYLYYVDRKKFMIRRSGENIAPREVEDAIDELTGVAESAVVPVPDELRGEEVKALVKRTTGTVTEQAVVEQVASRLAAYKVPRYVEFVETFPKTPSERIQRATLAEAERERADHGWDREQ